jgi:hypothetical protein
MHCSSEAQARNLGTRSPGFFGSWSLHGRDPSKGPPWQSDTDGRDQLELSTSVEIGGRSAHRHRTVAFSAPHVKLEPHFQQIFR